MRSPLTCVVVLRSFGFPVVARLEDLPKYCPRLFGSTPFDNQEEAAKMLADYIDCQDFAIGRSLLFCRSAAYSSLHVFERAAKSIEDERRNQLISLQRDWESLQTCKAEMALLTDSGGESVHPGTTYGATTAKAMPPYKPSESQTLRRQTTPISLSSSYYAPERSNSSTVQEALMSSYQGDIKSEKKNASQLSGFPHAIMPRNLASSVASAHSQVVHENARSLGTTGDSRSSPQSSKHSLVTFPAKGQLTRSSIGALDVRVASCMGRAGQDFAEKLVQDAPNKSKMEAPKELPPKSRQGAASVGNPLGMVKTPSRQPPPIAKVEGAKLLPPLKAKRPGVVAGDGAVDVSKDENKGRDSREEAPAEVMEGVSNPQKLKPSTMAPAPMAKRPLGRLPLPPKRTNSVSEKKLKAGAPREAEGGSLEVLARPADDNAVEGSREEAKAVVLQAPLPSEPIEQNVSRKVASLNGNQQSPPCGSVESSEEKNSSDPGAQVFDDGHLTAGDTALHEGQSVGVRNDQIAPQQSRGSPVSPDAEAVQSGNVGEMQGSHEGNHRRVFVASAVLLLQ
ncbi:hypothetical protein Emag_007530 [Eimeria magna]